MKQYQIAKNARALITNEGNWTHGAYARDRSKGGVDPNSKYAVCFCLMGALRKASGAQSDGDLHAHYPDLFGMLQVATDEQFPHRFNDTHTHAEVLQALDNVVNCMERAGL